MLGGSALGVSCSLLRQQHRAAFVSVGLWEIQAATMDNLICERIEFASVRQVKRHDLR